MIKSRYKVDFPVSRTIVRTVRRFSVSCNIEENLFAIFIRVLAAIFTRLVFIVCRHTTYSLRKIHARKKALVKATARYMFDMIYMLSYFPKLSFMKTYVNIEQCYWIYSDTNNRYICHLELQICFSDKVFVFPLSREMSYT